MLAAYASLINADNPLAGLTVGDRPEPDPQPGWTIVEMRAASLNHHDLWSLQGVGLSPERLPMILGCDAAGIDSEGNRVLVYPVVAVSGAGGGDETLDPRRTILSELHQGTFSERVAVPKHQLVPLPPEWSFVEAACLPTAWLTAYRMLAVRSGLLPGNTVLVQGAGGGVSTACIALGVAMGLRVWVTSRDQGKRRRAEELGADQSFEAGARLPARVDAVMETVGAATWEHSIRSLKPGGTIVVSGATSGPNPPAMLGHVFFRQLSVVGSTMGTLAELRSLIDLCTWSGIRPTVDDTYPLADARRAFSALAGGDVFGKIVITNS